jgi:uncharacterized protein with HEPN domain
MSKDLRIPDYLKHMSEAIAKITAYVAGMDWPAFSASSLTQDATIRNFEIIGEAARNVLRADPKFSQRHPDFPLVDAVGMRNTLTHGYFGVKLDVVWRTVQDDLPKLALQIEQTISTLDRDSDAPGGGRN